MRSYNVYITCKNTDDRLKRYDLKEVIVDESSKINCRVKVDTKKRFQKILGFGGALTESSAYVLSKIEDEKRKDILESYFDCEKGIGYNFARVHINSCDFALENYSYVEENDETLESFTLDRAEKYVLPLVREVKDIKNDELNILASPWSPPSYMKTNKEMNHGGKISNKYKQLWADYYVKYIEEMKKKDFDIWGVTVQNEPAAKQVWDSCLYSAEEERDFVKDYLGPTFEKNNLSHKKIIIWDHNRDLVYDRAKTVLEDKEANKYVWGTGIHWYVSEDFENVSRVHEAFPDKHIIFTEGCQEGGVHLGDWNTGERYGRNIIGDLNNYVEAWIDWNIVLDETGGPNHVGNLCDAPIIVDLRKDEVIYNSSFYYIAHFSKFIKKDSIRVLSEVDNEKIYALSCIDEKDNLCIIIMNENSEDKKITLDIDGEIVNINLRGNSIYTLLE
ncbi:MAG: glucosylceramidase [Clostridium sp.]|uniref:glycoside hydrolase family 30 protein n=1 Tax=Clostridium sp. TaxID=1506 RepID=UPI001EC89BF3|nr:glucosylceramidase [Clostridium sp.]MBS5884728.1 glucosylceramidase [Clostridium sp.]MDU7149389.1 glucosylceramidase [Clostridium sp.]MDU7242683.1 glucosylceramidase [Clostridium sp.]